MPIGACQRAATGRGPMNERPETVAMRFDLDDDQRLFHETVRRFVEAEMPVARVRALLDDPDGWTRPWWREAAQLGWTSFLVAEEWGGGTLSGAGPVDLAL